MYNIFDNLDQIELAKAEEFMTKHNLSKEDLINLQLPLIIILNLSIDEINERLEKVSPKKTVSKKIKKDVKDKKTKKESNINIKEVNEVKSEVKNSDLFSNLNLNNIKILTDMSMMEAYNSYNDMKHEILTPVYEVTLPISGYNAKMRGLKLDELDYIRNSILSDKNSFRSTIEHIVYSCIVDTGIKNFSKDAFLKGTSLLDFDCLLFGVMRNTYGALNGLSFICPHCGQEFEQKILTEDLVFTQNEDISKIIHDLSVQDKTEYFENSVLKQMHKRFIFKNSGILVDLKFPNLIKDKLIEKQFSKNLNEELKSTRRYFILAFIDKLYIPIIKNDQLEGFYPIESTQEIYRKLEDVSIEDMGECIDVISNLTERYKIEFKTPKLLCSHCKSEIDRSPFNISDNFFQKVIGS